VAELSVRIELFLRLAELLDRRRVQCTGTIARAVGRLTPDVRKELLRMEKAGTVQRYRPWCRQGSIWWERVAGSARAPTTLANVTPPRDLRTQLPKEADHA